MLRSVGSMACVLLAILTSGCAKDTGPSTETTRSSAATSASTAPFRPPPTTAVVICNGANEVNQDDDGAVQALLEPPQLPPGDWSTAETPPCPWALSADELLDVRECRAAATSQGAPANDEQRNGNARVTFTRSDGMQLDHRVEIYTSRQNVDAVRAILAGPSMPACYTAALHARAATEPGTTVSGVDVDRFVVQPDAAALGLGFPAAAGYPADAGFADGVNITFTRTVRESSKPLAMRVITFGSGGLMSTLTLIGPASADLDAIDLTATLRAAAENFTTMFGLGR